MGVLKPPGNGLYLLTLQPERAPSPTADILDSAGPRVALTAQCDPILWHRRFGYLKYAKPRCPNQPNTSQLYKNVSCD
jgi:hypothetical protein